jgi:hypothetical protein
MDFERRGELEDDLALLLTEAYSVKRFFLMSLRT